MDGWRHVLWCSTAQTHVIEVGWTVVRFGGQSIWQTYACCGTSFWSRCAQNVPACIIHLHFLFAVSTHGYHGKIGCLSICELVDASCAVPGLRARDGGGLPCNCRSISPLLKVMTVCPLELESSYMPRVKGKVGCRICDLFCASVSLVSWHWSVHEIMARSREEWLMTRCGVTRCTVSCIASQTRLCSALDSGQTWGLVVARLAEDGICPRCKEALENLMHRLWYCPANEQYRVQLNSLVPTAVSFPEPLPHTLARTGIPPAGWDVLSLKGSKCLLNYLWCSAADGTSGVAREHRGLPEAPPFAFDRVKLRNP